MQKTSHKNKNQAVLMTMMTLDTQAQVRSKLYRRDADGATASAAYLAYNTTKVDLPLWVKDMYEWVNAECGMIQYKMARKVV